MPQAQRISVPETRFRKAYLSGIITQSIVRCGLSETAICRRIFGGIVMQIKIDDHVYTGEVETIAEALIGSRTKEDFVEAIGSAALVDDSTMLGVM